MVARNWRYYQRQQHEREERSSLDRVKEEIEGAVRSGRMSRKQADAEYERIKKTQSRKKKLPVNFILKLREGMKELQSQSERENSVKRKPAEKERALRRNLQREIHLAHREIDLEPTGKKITSESKKVV